MLSRERLQERFIEMIKIYSPSKGEKEMADWIENWLRERNIPFQSDHAGEAYGGNGRNIVAFVKGNTKERPLGFAAHMDQIEPCRNVNPVINGNIISTDKTTTLGGDDKAGISAIMEAVEDIIESGVPHRYLSCIYLLRRDQYDGNKAHGYVYAAMQGTGCCRCNRCSRDSRIQSTGNGSD